MSKLLPKWFLHLYRDVKYNVLDLYYVKSYSQEGEDLILRRIFERKQKGYYVDIGAHHPKRFSNTYLFYKRGWKGINIEPNPGAINLFNKYRSRDVNLELCVSDQVGKLTYFMFNEPALNSFDEEISKARELNTRYYIIDKRKLNAHRLDEILDKYLPNGINIDFMSIDVEGHDINVIRSNNWSIYRPKCLLVESLNSDLAAAISCPIHRYLDTHNYQLFAKTFNTLFYLDTEGAAK